MRSDDRGRTIVQSGTVDRDGFRLEWIREGRGEPMIVVGASRFYPRYFPSAMRDHFDMVFCDLRQWVPTPPGYDIARITRDTFSDDIDAVRQAVGFERPIVAGQSQHGMMALEYARRYPDRTRGVIAVAPNPPAGAKDGLETRKQFWERDAGPDRRATHERNLATRRAPETATTSEEFIEEYVADGAIYWYDAAFDSTPLWDGVWLNMEVEDQVFAPEAFGGFDVAGLDVPVFLALGRYDYGTPYIYWERPKDRLSALTYKLYDRSAHQPPYEQPEEFTADVVEWARTLRP